MGENVKSVTLSVSFEHSLKPKFSARKFSIHRSIPFSQPGVSTGESSVLLRSASKYLDGFLEVEEGLEHQRAMFSGLGWIVRSMRERAHGQDGGD